MKRLGVANPKGGVGKTTVAVTVAVLAAQLGRRVFLIDADPNRSASELAEEYGDAAPFDFATEDNPRELSRLRANHDYDLVVVDLPGAREGGQLRGLLEGAGGEPAVDGLLMPTPAEALALRALNRALREEVLPTKIPYAIVLTMVHPGRHSIENALERAEELRGAGLHVLQPIIRRYVAHSDAQWDGTPITGFGGKHAIARRAEDDMREVAAAALGPELLKLRWAARIRTDAEEASAHG